MSSPEKDFEFTAAALKEPWLYESHVYKITGDFRSRVTCIGSDGSEAPGMVDQTFLEYVEGGKKEALSKSTDIGFCQKHKTSKTGSDYSYATFYLGLCKNAAQGLLEKREAWGIHIFEILAFYERIKLESDQILENSVQFHPELEQFRLAEIHENHINNIQLVARAALAYALTEKLTKSPIEAVVG